MLRILVVAVLLAAALVAVKRDHVLQRAGLAGSCSRVVAPARDGASWQACLPGRLEGRPDLSSDSCTRESIRGRIEYWRCPAPVDSAPHA